MNHSEEQSKNHRLMFIKAAWSNLFNKLKYLPAAPAYCRRFKLRSQSTATAEALMEEGWVEKQSWEAGLKREERNEEQDK